MSVSGEQIDFDGTPVVHVSGEIDVYTAPDFDRAVKEGIARATKVLVIDLRDISYLDSAGLSVLLGAYRTLSGRGAELYVVISPNQPAVYRVLEVTRLDSFIHVRNSLEEIAAELKFPKAA